MTKKGISDIHGILKTPNYRNTHYDNEKT